MISGTLQHDDIGVRFGIFERDVQEIGRIAAIGWLWLRPVQMRA